MNWDQNRKKNLELYGSIPKNSPFSDYYFSIIFLTQPQNLGPTPSVDNSNASSAQAGIAMNVLLSVGPKGEPKGELREFSADGFFEEGPVPFTVRIKNNGSQFLTPQGFILIKNMFGQTVGRVDLEEGNILSGTIRALGSKNIQSNSAVKGESPKAVWSEKFLFGYYTASLQIALSEKGPLFKQDIRFFAFPGKLLVGIIIAAGIVFTIIRRLRKLSNQ